MLKQFRKVVATKIISDVGPNKTLVLCQFGYSLTKEQMVVFFTFITDG